MAFVTSRRGIAALRGMGRAVYSASIVGWAMLACSFERQAAGQPARPVAQPALGLEACQKGTLM